MIYENKKGTKSIFGIFESRSELEHTIDRLKMDGFRASDISVLMPSGESATNFAHEKSSKAPEGVTAGATSGIAVGGILGWLAGIGSLAVPGVGPLIAAGPILAAIAGAGVGGALGGLTGGLIGMGIPEYEAKRYETYVRDGGLLLSVHVDDSDWAEKAKDILDSCGAKDIASVMEKGPMLNRDSRFDQTTRY